MEYTISPEQYAHLKDNGFKPLICQECQRIDMVFNGQLANARLIAAAPDLYEALAEICTILSMTCSMDYLYKHNLSLPLSKGKQAIAKVEKG